MPRYRVTALSFVDNMLVQPGTEIETDATPAAHWEPLDKPAKKASDDATEAEAKRMAAQAQQQAAVQGAAQVLAAAGLADPLA